MFSFISNNESETRKFAHKFMSKLPLGSVVLLRGDLGAGKTSFVKGVAEFLNIKEKVLSPTFNIMKVYGNEKPLIHIDAYRLENVNSNIGLDEYIGYPKGFTFIEWPDYIKELLPKKVINVSIFLIEDNKRKIEVEGIDL